MPKTIDLNRYAVFETPQLEVKKVYDTIEDYKAVEKFNKSMVEVHRDYFTKEKRSCISAKKLVLTE